MKVCFWNGENWETADHDGRILIEIGDQKFTLIEWREMLSISSNHCKLSVEVQDQNTIFVQDRYVDKPKDI